MLNQMQCKSCGATIPPDMIHADRKLAVCPYCRAVYDWKVDPRAAPVHNLGKPAGFAVARQSGKLLMRFPLRSWEHKLGLLFITAAIDVATATLVVNATQYSFGNSPKFAALLSAGLTLAWTLYVIMLVINDGELYADHKTVRYSEKPITLGPKVFKAHEISQVYVRQEHRRTKHGGYYVYQVCFLLTNGESQTVVRGLRNPEHSLYIEQELESLLNIEPAPVYGAYR